MDDSAGGKMSDREHRSICQRLATLVMEETQPEHFGTMFYTLLDLSPDDASLLIRIFMRMRERRTGMVGTSLHTHHVAPVDAERCG